MPELELTPLEKCDHEPEPAQAFVATNKLMMIYSSWLHYCNLTF